MSRKQKRCHIMRTINRAPNHWRKTTIAAALALLNLPVAAQELVLEEVIVTAQKRESSLQDISATVNVVTGDAIDKFSALSFDDIEAQTAGLSLATPDARNPRIAMRGVAIDQESGAEATVDVYWNGQVVNSNIAFSQLYDMERIEVLRGPQGTLQGRASPAGAINMLTRSADLSESGGYAQLTLGDNEGINGQVAYGAPIIDDRWAVRVAAVYDTNYARNVENITTGLDDPEMEATSYRLNTVWGITDKLVANLTYQHFDRDIDDPWPIDGKDSLGERPTLASTDLIALAATNNLAEFEFDLLNLRLDWEIGDHTLSSITGWSDQTRDYLQDNDRANYVTNPLAGTTQNSTTKQDIFVQELRLASNGNEFWDYMVGLYYQDQDVSADFYADTTVSLTADTPVLGPLVGDWQFTTSSYSSVPVTSEQASIFMFNQFYFTDTMTLEFGLRYTEYERSRAADVAHNGYPWFDLPEGVPDAIGDLVKGFVERDFPISGVSKENQKTDEDSWTGSLTFRWEASDNVSLYAGYNRGYRPSGISIVPSPGIAFLPNGEDDLLHDEEESDAMEFGFKSRLLDGRAALNGALYFQKYDGYLGFVRGVEVLNDSGVAQVLPAGLIFNGDANIWGIEFDGQMLLSETWSLGGALSYVNAEWDGAEKPCNDRQPGEALGFCDIDGERVGGQPPWSASLNSEYYWPLESTEIYLRGLWKYTGERDNVSASAGLGNVTDEFDAYSVLNMWVGWRSSSFDWDVSLWAKNLLDADEDVYQEGPDQYDTQLSGGSYTWTNVVPERTIGVTARYNF
jgi:outer membrane receptor protein involved in Fe transport